MSNLASGKVQQVIGAVVDVVGLDGRDRALGLEEMVEDEAVALAGGLVGDAVADREDEVLVDERARAGGGGELVGEADVLAEIEGVCVALADELDVRRVRVIDGVAGDEGDDGVAREGPERGVRVLEDVEPANDHFGNEVTVEGEVVGLDRLRVDWLGEIAN